MKQEKIQKIRKEIKKAYVLGDIIQEEEREEHFYDILLDLGIIIRGKWNYFSFSLILLSITTYVIGLIIFVDFEWPMDIYFNLEVPLKDLLLEILLLVFFLFPIIIIIYISWLFIFRWLHEEKNVSSLWVLYYPLYYVITLSISFLYSKVELETWNEFSPFLTAFFSFFFLPFFLGYNYTLITPSPLLIYFVLGLITITWTPPFVFYFVRWIERYWKESLEGYFQESDTMKKFTNLTKVFTSMDLEDLADQLNFPTQKALIEWLSNDPARKLNFTISERKIFFGYIRQIFFCQLDSQNHPASDSAYQCAKCSRFICYSCYEEQTEIGLYKCPYCKGKFNKIQ